MICPNCGAENDNSACFCKKCGQSLLPESVCKNCGAQNEADAVFCEKCGNRLQGEDTADKGPYIPQEKKRKKKVGLLLGLAAFVIVIAAAVGIVVVRPIMLRSQVDKYIENMQYAKAQSTYEKLPNTMQDQTEYLVISLLADIENGNYVAASSKLVRLGGYDDAADLVDKADSIINIINGNGITLQADQSNVISNAIESIASEAQDKELKELEKDHLPSLVGTWKQTEYWSVDEWEEYDFAVFAEHGVPDNRTIIKYNADGTLEGTRYYYYDLSDNDPDSTLSIAYYESIPGYEVEQLFIFPDSYLALYGSAYYRISWVGEWKTEGNNTLITYSPSKNGELKANPPRQFTFEGDVLVISNYAKYERQ